MNKHVKTMTTMAVAGLLTAGAAVIAKAQHIEYRSHPSSLHFDHYETIVRDSHGHGVEQRHRDTVHALRRPSIAINGRLGSLFIQDGRVAYAPTSSSSSAYRVARPAAMQFGSFSHVDELAARLESQTNEFLMDLHYNYAHNPGFRETYLEAYQLYEVAKYIHATEHHGDRHLMQQKLVGMDELFHHIQDDVNRHHHRQCGALGIVAKMEQIEETLHHLMDDVGLHFSAPASAAVEVPLPSRSASRFPPVPLPGSPFPGRPFPWMP